MFDRYDPGKFYDEMFGQDGSVRPYGSALYERFSRLELKDEVIPRFYIEQAKHYRPEFRGVDVPGDIYIHICGSDLIRGGPTANTTCSRTTAAARPARPTCWKTATP